MRDANHLFTLRVAVRRGEPLVIIHAFDANKVTTRFGHQQIDVEVKHGGKVIFTRGATHCAVAAGTTLDGIQAKELVLNLVSMKPGDTDPEYFASYTPEQLAWAEAYGEDISVARADRYCDESGDCRA